MGLIKRGILIVLALLLFIGACISIFGANALVFLYPDVYYSILEKNNAYDIIDSGLALEGQLAFTSLHEEGTKNFTNKMISNLLTYIRGESSNPNLTLQIKKEVLMGFFESQVEKVRECNKGEDLFNKPALCKPAGLNTSEYLEVFLKERNIIIFEEGSINLLDTFDKERNIEKLRDNVVFYKGIFYTILFFSIIIAILIIVLNAKERHKGFRWIGIPLIFAGITAVIVSTLAERMIVVSLIKELPEFLLFVINLIRYYFDQVFLIGFYIIAAGIVLFIASFFIGLIIPTRK